LTTAICVFPMALSRSLSGARYISLAALISLTFTLLVVIIEMPFYKKFYAFENTDPIIAADHNKMVWACPSFQFFNGAGITFFAFTN
jgi:hypothetical protein